jgi:vancomycin resistance protein YoaR
LPDWVFELKMGDWPLCILAAEQGNIGRLREEMAAYRIHASGIWSATQPVEKHLAVVAMYEKLLHYLSDQYRRRIVAMLAEYELKAAIEFEKREDRGAAVEHLTRSFRYRLSLQPERSGLFHSAADAADKLLIDYGREFPIAQHISAARSIGNHAGRLLVWPFRVLSQCKRGLEGIFRRNWTPRS